VLPIFHFALPEDVSVGNRDLLDIRRSESVRLVQILPRRYVRAFPTVLAPIPLSEHGEHSPFKDALDKNIMFQVSHSLTIQESYAAARKLLWLHTPARLLQQDFHPVAVDVASARWSKAFNTLLPVLHDVCRASFFFKSKKPTKCSSFTVYCLYRNPRGGLFSPGFWLCEACRNWEVGGPGERHHRREDVVEMSGHDDVSSPVSATVDLTRHGSGYGRQRAVVTLRREPGNSTTSGPARFSIEVTVEEDGNME